MTRALRFGAFLIFLAGLVAVAIWFASTRKTSFPAATSSAAVSPSASEYIDNRLCLGCHQQQAEQWQHSHHALAMAVANTDSVRGNFKNATFSHHGVTSRFFMRDNTCVVNTENADGKLADFEIAYTFGVAPLQQYLIAMPGGRLQPLQIAWDDVRKRWFHLRPDENTPPNDVLHWTGRYQTANTMCLSCHTTGYEKRYDADTDTFASRWAEPNVSCQSCHGPGAAHVKWASAVNKKDAAAAGEHFGLTVDTGALSSRQTVDLCAPCHSRRSELVPNPLPGAPRFDNYLPLLLTDNLYYADGQQLDEVFVDGSFRQSKMYAHGVSCTNCHNPHTGKLKLEGNALCTQCHNPQGNPLFAGAVGNYDSPAHHFHASGSAGAQCVSCHMPAKNYMQIQSRPDHSIRIPRPDLSVKIGTPNACNGCHADKSPRWAANSVVAWYGPKTNREIHYGEIFAAARTGDVGAQPQLAHLALDQQKPALVRATALHYLQDDGAGIETRIKATRDADPEVRAKAAESLASIDASQRIAALVPLLTDTTRAARIAAAYALSSIPPQQFAANARIAFDNALAEYIAAQNVALDMPGAQFNLAMVYQNTGKFDLAEKHYVDALRIDPDFVPARSNLATLYNMQARNADAERILTQGVQRQPQAGELYYALGLLLAEEDRLPESADALRKAAQLLPGNARVHYNYALALQQLNHHKEAEPELLRAAELEPNDAATIYALAVLYMQQGRTREALPWAEKLRALQPGDPQVQAFTTQIRNAIVK